MACSVFLGGSAGRMAQLLFTAGVLAVVIVGMLIMMQILGWEQIGTAIRRSIALLALVFLAVWFLKVLVLPILICSLVWLKGVMLRTLVIVLVAVAMLALLRVLTRALVKRSPLHHSRRGE
jgi:hypothetical protein